MTNRANPAAPAKITVLLPGWADEASSKPHPAPLLEPIEIAVARSLGITFSNLAAIPGAASRWLAINGEPAPSDTLVCADPVHLIAGSDDALLVPIQRLELSKRESEELLRDLNRILSEESVSFLHDSEGNWYYQGLCTEALETAPPSAVEGNPMTAALPRSKQARQWLSLWSEAQMVLHQSPVNHARQARGEPTVNSVWLWGGGKLPRPLEHAHTILYADDPFAQGLAKALNIPCLPLEASAAIDLAEPATCHHVVLDTTLMQKNPDFIEQRDQGEAWLQRLSSMLSTQASAEAQLNGLTGCCEALLPAGAKSSSVFVRLANLFKR